MVGILRTLFIFLPLSRCISGKKDHFSYSILQFETDTFHSQKNIFHFTLNFECQKDKLKFQCFKNIAKSWILTLLSCFIGVKIIWKQFSFRKFSCFIIFQVLCVVLKISHYKKLRYEILHFLFRQIQNTLGN